MRRNMLFGSLLVAAGLALACGPAVRCMAPWLGIVDALIVCPLLAVLIYLLWIAPDRRRGLLVGLAGGLLLLVVGAVAATPSEALLGAALVLAVCRSGLLYRSRPARSLLLEAVLVASGLLFARLLAVGSGPGMALELWGFLLVQSLFFVVGGVSARAADGTSGDAFSLARDRALSLMDEPRG
jgi:hypothetical protein